jgi:predicted GIY-YIG superfamily endonuclease
MKEHRYFVYILANAPRNLYIGFTSGLRKRVWEHKTKVIDCFTNSWHDYRLV